MEYFPLIIALFLILILARNMKGQKKKEESQEIARRMAQLKEIDNLIESRTIDTSVNLTKIEIEVLDMYERSNIRIPSDILEDLRHLNLDNKTEILAFIENQRYFWKLENTKKPYKKGGE